MAMPLTYTTDAFARALRQAGSAHGVYEEALGQGRDEDWAVWYAQHMAREATEGAASPPLTFAGTEELAHALLRAETAHLAHAEAEPDWAPWYTDHLVREQTGAEVDS